MRQDQDRRIPVAEYKAWSDLTGKNLKPIEFKILKSMDESYLAAFRRELKDNKARVDRQNEARAMLGRR